MLIVNYLLLIISARRKVQKDGANKGREFYCCAKPRDSDDQCRYFQWVDEVDGLGGGGGGGGGGAGAGSMFGIGGRGAGGGRGRGGVKRKASGDGGGPKQRKCGLCHEPGHTRNRCPMKD